MELTEKQGFKQSEVGLIPEDWDALELNGLGATGRPVIKAGPFGSSLKKEFYVSDGYKIYGQEQVIKNDPFYGDYFINKERYSKLKSCKVLPGDILLSLVGTFGKVLVIPEKALKGIINPRLLRISVDKNKFHTKYISYFLRSTKAIGILESKLQGGTMGVLNASILKSFQFPLPPTLKEQKAIATALSDVDELINGLENLITKKKAVKKGAMQQLLTPPYKGGKRLAGFSGEWVEKTLGELSHIKTGSRNNQDKVEDGEYPFYVRSQSVKRIDTYSYDEEAVLIPGEGGIGTIFHYINGKFEVHQRVYKISSFSEGVFGKFIFLKMKHEFYEHAMTNSVKATVDSLRLPTFHEFEICLPQTLEEQKAIAQILSDMDADIEQLESKKAKYHNIKQGMMQELLTGKTRLI